MIFTIHDHRGCNKGERGKVIRTELDIRILMYTLTTLMTTNEPQSLTIEGYDFVISRFDYGPHLISFFAQHDGGKHLFMINPVEDRGSVSLYDPRPNDDH